MTAPDTDSRPTSPRPPRRWRRRVAHRAHGAVGDCGHAGGASATPPSGHLRRAEGADARAAQPGESARRGPGDRQLPSWSHPPGRPTPAGRARARPHRAAHGGLSPAATASAHHSPRLADRHGRHHLGSPAGRAAGTSLDVMQKASDTTGGGGFAHRPAGRARRGSGRDAGARFGCATPGAGGGRARTSDWATRRWRRSTGFSSPCARRRATAGSAYPLGAALTADEVRLDPLRVYTEASELNGHVVLPRSLREARLVNRLDVRLNARPLALADLAALTPSVPAAGELVFDAEARGEGDLVTAHLAATLDQGRLTLDAGTRLRDGKPTSYRARGVVSRLDLSRLTRAAPAGEVNGRLDADINGPLASADGSARLDLGGSRFGTVTVHRLEVGALLSGGTADLTVRRCARFRHGARDRPCTTVRFAADLSHLGCGPRNAGHRRRGPGAHRGRRRSLAVDRVPDLGRGNFAGLRPGERSGGPGRGPRHGRAAAARRRDPPAGRRPTRHSPRDPGGRGPRHGGGPSNARAIRSATSCATAASTEVDVAALAGDTTSAPLSGRFTLTGRGTAPRRSAGDGGASPECSFVTARDGSSGWTRPSGWIVVTCA